jgi:hypothetical protein
MRKLLLCLALVGTSLAVSDAPKQAEAQILPICSSYCCTSPNATSTTQCRHNGVTRTCAWYWFNWACP